MKIQDFYNWLVRSDSVVTELVLGIAAIKTPMSKTRRKNAGATVPT